MFEEAIKAKVQSVQKKIGNGNGLTSLTNYF